MFTHKSAFPIIGTQLNVCTFLTVGGFLTGPNTLLTSDKKKIDISFQHYRGDVIKVQFA